MPRGLSRSYHSPAAASVFFDVTIVCLSYPEALFFTLGSSAAHIHFSLSRLPTSLLHLPFISLSNPTLTYSATLRLRSISSSPVPLPSRLPRSSHSSPLSASSSVSPRLRFTYLHHSHPDFTLHILATPPPCLPLPSPPRPALPSRCRRHRCCLSCQLFRCQCSVLTLRLT